MDPKLVLHLANLASGSTNLRQQAEDLKTQQLSQNIVSFSQN